MQPRVKPPGPDIAQPTPSPSQKLMSDIFAERLTPEGARWLRKTPVVVRPLITAKRHPHIINRLALLWGSNEDATAYLDSLVISSRPERRGFAMEVLTELCDLQRWLEEKSAE